MTLREIMEDEDDHQTMSGEPEAWRRLAEMLHARLRDCEIEGSYLSDMDEGVCRACRYEAERILAALARRPLGGEGARKAPAPDVECHIGREKWEAIARIIDDPDLMYDERILLVASQAPAQRE